MTIVSVVFVPEGIAMAADSRLTGSKKNDSGGLEHFTVTDNAQKLMVIRDSTIGISFYGDAIIGGKTVSDFLRVFDIEEVDSSDTVEIIANKLQKYLQTHSKDLNVLFLIAGYDEDKPFVFNVDKNVAVILNQNDQGELEYGAGWRGDDSVMNRLFTGSILNPNLMPLRDAADLAEFIVDTTVNFLRFEDKISTCGGPTDSLVITKDYTKFLKHKILQP